MSMEDYNFARAQDGWATPVKIVQYNCTCGRTMKFESKEGVVAPQRTWVGLASEDRLTAKYMQDAPDGIEAVIDYIESKLKELNT